MSAPRSNQESVSTPRADSGLSSNDFRMAMRQLASTVTVVTCSDCGNEAAMTATSVCSVSVQPPQLLVCVNRSGRTCELITRSGKFAINVLSAEQTELARHYAAPNRAAGSSARGRWLRSSSAPPLLADATVAFSCEVEQAVESGTHTIFIGRVVDLRHEAEAEAPLVYRHGAFGQFAESPPEAALDILNY